LELTYTLTVLYYIIQLFTLDKWTHTHTHTHTHIFVGTYNPNLNHN